jgi:ABC-type sugar transport system substrate-binding protein
VDVGRREGDVPELVDAHARAARVAGEALADLLRGAGEVVVLHPHHRAPLARRASSATASAKRALTAT